MARDMTPDDDGMPDGLPSKSQRKRDMTALQEMGEQIAQLTPQRLKRCMLPESLLHAVTEFQRLPNRHGARRRQLQYIGKLMRDLDEEQISLIQQVLSRP